MELYGIGFKKEYGQNFLTDADTVCRIAEECCTDSRTILEIGPGIGCMTRELADRAEKVFAVEIDESLMPVLANIESSTSMFSFITHLLLLLLYHKFACLSNDTAI